LKNKKLIKTVKPTHGIIPIRTDAPEAFEALFGDVASVWISKKEK
jgi:hypothetical protein